MSHHIGNKKIYFIIMGFNIVFIICLLLFGGAHYATNDDVTLNNIAVGNYGIKNQPYLVFGNISYGYLLNLFYRFIPSLNWYAIFPIIIAISCFCVLVYLFMSRTSIRNGFIVSLILLFLFGKAIFVDFQFTHFAAFFSAIGLVIIYWNSQIGYKKFSLLSIYGIFIALLGYCIRSDAFISICPIILIIILWDFCKVKRWKNNFKNYVACMIPWIILFVCIIFLSIINYCTYNKNEDWKYYVEYNKYRSELLDYEVPDYETYQAEYNKMGIDKLDYELFCSWNYADLNKFSLNTVKQMYELQQAVSKNNFNIWLTLKQFIKDIINSISDFGAIPFLIVLTIIYISLGFKNLWVLIPASVLMAELFYLSYIERFIFRSYMGLWVIYGLVLMYHLFNTKNYVFKLSKKWTIVFSIGIFVLHLPWMYDLWSNHYLIAEKVRIQDQNYQWRSILSEDKENLYVCDTLFNGVPDTLAVFSNVTLYNHNMYSLGGWTCPAPLEQYLLEDFNVKSEGLFPGFIDDDKNVYYIDTIGENKVNRLLEYIQKEYNESANYEIVNSINNINVYRFFVDKNLNIKDAITTNKVVSDIQIHESEDGDYNLNGWAKIDGYDAYKQTIWFEIYNEMNDKNKYIKASKTVRLDVSEKTGILHDAATGIECLINKDSLDVGDNEVYIVIQYGNKIFKSKSLIANIFVPVN